MKTGTKVLIGLGVAVSIGGIIAYNKFKKLIGTFSKIEIEPINLRNVKIQSGIINFNVDISLSNPTSENFAIKTSIAKLEKVNFFYKGNYIATANAVFNEISIPANNKLIIKNIPVSAPVVSVLQNIFNFLDFKEEHLSAKAFVNVAGKQFIIE